MVDTKKEYYFSKIAIILTFLLLIVILLLFVFVIYFLYLADLKIAVFICLFISVLFLTVLPDFYKRINFFLADRPALILTKDDFIDNINFQKIKWTDINTISSASVNVKGRVRYIAISLIDPDKYIKEIKSPYKRLIARLNQKYFGGTFSIQPNIVKCDNDELLASMTDYFDKSKMRKTIASK